MQTFNEVHCTSKYMAGACLIRHHTPVRLMRNELYQWCAATLQRINTAIMDNRSAFTHCAAERTRGHRRAHTHK